MSEKRAPAFQFYPMDFLSDPNVMSMTYAEVGMYWFLCSYAWLDDCSIPAELGQIARLLRVPVSEVENAWPLVGKCFKPHPTDCTKLVHPRLLKEREKQREWKEKSAIGGKRSARKRKIVKKKTIEQGGCQMVDAKPQPDANSSSSSSTSVFMNKSPLVKRSGDLFYLAFAEAHQEQFEIPYQHQKADFVRLAALKKSIASGQDPPDWWRGACLNYVSSPLGKYTLADLCSRVSVFKAHPVDRFGKPALPPMALRLATDEDKRNYNPNARGA